MESDYKLCGFLQAVFTAPSPPHSVCPGAHLSLFEDGHNVALRTEGGAVLLPLGEAAAAAAEEVSIPDKSTAGFGGAAGTPVPSSSKKRKRRRVAGVVNGSMGVVRQLHALTVRKCLRFDARVVGVCEREDGEGRVVVLIDLYMPIAVWIDWQFPKSGALAACLFKHASTEEQVISRAHRMGATRPINVETLAMQGTIEEQMLNFLQDVNACGRTLKQESNKEEYEGTRTHRTLHDFAESNYLAQLNFVRTNVNAQ